VNVKTIRRIMGHQDVKMTLGYIHPADETLRAAVEFAVNKSSKIVPGVGEKNRPGVHTPLRAAV
jgi:hypothetical protein